MATDRVRELLEEFAEKLEHVLKQDLRDAIERGLGIDGGGVRARAGSNGHRAARGKRDAAALDALQERFVVFVAKHPGLRIEQINAQLGTTTKDLALPIRKLVANGTLKTAGRRRSTTYVLGARKSKRRAKK